MAEDRVANPSGGDEAAKAKAAELAAEERPFVVIKGEITRSLLDRLAHCEPLLSCRQAGKRPFVPQTMACLGRPG